MGTSLTTPNKVLEAYKSHLDNLGMWQEQDSEYVRYLMSRLKRVSKTHDDYLGYLVEMADIKLSHNVGQA